MDDLSTLVHSLDEKEQLEFQFFIQRNRNKKQRKDLALFRAIVSGETYKGEGYKQLEIPNANAYHAVRRRLYRHLSDFILLRAVQEDMNSISRVNGMLSVARHLFEAGSGKVAWKTLERAEKLANDNELFEALNEIFLLQAEMIEQVPDGRLPEIIARYEKNKEKLILSERIAIAKSMVRQKVLKFKKEGRDIDLAAVLKDSVKAFELQEQMLDSPKLLYGMLSTIRESVIASKDFHSFGPIVENAFASLKEKGDHYNNTRILYMLAHAKYRNKRFASAECDLATMEVELVHCDRMFRRQMMHKLLQLRAGNLLFLEELARSIDILEGLLQDKFLNEHSANNVRLNLVVYHFLNSDPKQARETLKRLQHSDKWYKEHMGIEWSLKRDLLELLLFHELNEPDLVSSRLRSIQRRYKELFHQKTYKRVQVFLALIKEYMENETLIDLHALEEKVEVSWDWLPKEEEDLQAMMFFAWFRSKLNGKALYANILELIAA